eukprot:15463444-Alexandrium_andersonii.AAC.1
MGVAPPVGPSRSAPPARSPSRFVDAIGFGARDHAETHRARASPVEFEAMGLEAEGRLLLWGSPGAVRRVLPEGGRCRRVSGA